MTPYDNYSPEIPYTQDLPQASLVGGVIPEPQKKTKSEKNKESGRAKKKSAPSKRQEKESDSSRESFSNKVTTWVNGRNIRLILGIFLACLGTYLGIAFISYFFDCVKDQAAIYHTAVGTAKDISNAAGEGGARLSEILINQSFGVGSFVIIFWLFAMASKNLLGKPKFKSVDFTIKSLVALITLSLIVGLLTIGFNSTVNWGGYHGRYVNEFIKSFLGWSGAAILCIFMLALFVVICMRDFVLWIIRMKKKASARRAQILAEKRERERKQRELEEMRRQEELDSLKAGETQSIDAEINDREDETLHFGNDDKTLSDVMYDISGDTDLTVSIPTGADSYTLQDDEAKIDSLDSTQEYKSLHNSLSDLSKDGSADNQVNDESENEDEEIPGDSDSMVVNVNQIAQSNQQSFPTAEGLPGQKPYKFPPVEILRQGVEKISVDASEQIENKTKIRKTLLDFGIPIKSIEATVGPTVTLYEIVPDTGVKIAKIRSLVDDIALSLSATGVRIIAPIPGKGTVGIEVANKDPQTVSMRSIIKSKKYIESKYRLPIALGSTISNDVFIADLAKMPHLLVAGATGQGKSVGLNAIIASLLYRKSPDELKFVMIDPKMVEFSLYAKIEQHYLAEIPDTEDPIITDMSKVVATLSSLCVEMDDRYQLLKTAHVRNVEEYNQKMIDQKLNPLEGHRYMPYIVIVVDEFSDLIMTAGKEVEMPIARLAQKARAVGMHVIIATQRPSTNVITGIIKANFPARIAFKVSSGVDSKTILDATGAQQLIGRGDMLISNNSEMIRVQCAFIDTPEVEEICDYIERQPYPRGPYILPDPIINGENEGGETSGVNNTFGEKDPLFDEVARTIVNSNTASTSSIQRRYSIGYNRAGKIMDQLEAAGVVGPAMGGKPRAVLVDANTLELILNPR